MLGGTHFENRGEIGLGQASGGGSCAKDPIGSARPRTGVDHLAFPLRCCCSSQISSVMSERTRFFLFWDRLDGLALFLAVVLLAGVGVALRVALAIMGGERGLRSYDHILLACLALGVLSAQTALDPYSGRFQLVWLVVAGVIGFSLGRPRSLVLRVAKGLCLILSPRSSSSLARS